MKDEAWVDSILRVMDARSPMDKNGYVFVKQLIQKYVGDKDKPLFDIADLEE